MRKPGHFQNNTDSFLLTCINLVKMPVHTERVIIKRFHKEKGRKIFTHEHPCTVRLVREAQNLKITVSKLHSLADCWGCHVSKSNETHHHKNILGRVAQKKELFVVVT